MGERREEESKTPYIQRQVINGRKRKRKRCLKDVYSRTMSKETVTSC